MLRWGTPALGTRRSVDRRARQLLADELGYTEPMTPSDLRVICLALEDRIGRHLGTPAGEAASKVRNKIERNMSR